MSFYTHRFEAQLNALVYPGNVRSFIIRRPPDFADLLPVGTERRVRAKGEINNRPVADAAAPTPSIPRNRPPPATSLPPNGSRS